MEIPLTSKPGSATSSANTLMRRSYKRRTRFFGGLRTPGLGLPRGLEPILLHPPVERAAAEFQSLGCLAYISLGTLQRLADQNGFDGFKTELFQILALRTQHVQPKIGPLDLVAAAHQDSALKGMLELPHIPRPGVLHEQLQCGGFEALNGPPVSRSIARQKMEGECRNIFPAFAQGRHVDLDCVQAK